MTDTRKDLIIEQRYWNFLFRFELNAPIEFVAFIAATTLHIISRRADVALRPSVNVVFSLQKGEWEKEARERKGTNEASDRELRERMRIETSYRYESATGCQPARLRASRMFLFIRRFSRFHSSRSLARNTFFLPSLPYRLLALLLPFPTLTLAEMYPVDGSVDEGAVNGFYSVSNWKPIGCRHCHKMRREIDVYRWSIQERFIIC